MAVRAASLLVVSLALAKAAAAQPADPYQEPAKPKQPGKPAPAPPAGPGYDQPPAQAAPVPAVPQAPAPVTPPDPVLAEQVARSLVYRAQELYDARVFADAKQLAIEALGKSPKGAAAEQARFLIKAINQELGIVDEPVKPAEQADVERPQRALRRPAR